MPRKSRIDVPGALHHIIVRGIDRQKIFKNDEGRNNFIGRHGRYGHLFQKLGITMVSLAVWLDQSVTAVAKAVIRGEKLAKENDYLFLGR